MKRFILLLIIILAIILIPINSFADEIEDEEIDFSQIQDEILETVAKPEAEPNINSRACVVIDRESKRILYGKKEKEKRAMASTTKIMTCIIALENSKLDETIIVCKQAASVGGSRLGLSTGDKITMNDLLYGLMLRSGNDAATQIAISIGGDYEGFARLMNKKAKELGLKDTHFVTPHGLDDAKHYTTAYELAILADYAMNNEKFASIVGTKKKTILVNGNQRELYNTNELLGYLNGVNGVKTGFTNNAGRCLVTSCTRKGINLISVVLGADTKKFRTKDSVQILEYAFSNFSKINLKEKIESTFEKWKVNNSIKVIKGKIDIIQPKLEMIPFDNYMVRDDEKDNIDIAIECKNELNAPILENMEVGEVSIILNGKNIMKLKLTASYGVSSKTILDYMIELLKCYTGKGPELLSNWM